MVIVGPVSRMRVTAIQAPARAATMGTSHTGEKRVRLFAIRFASGTGGSWMGWSAMLGLDLHLAPRIPDQTRIEGLHGEHRQYHHRGEEQQARSRGDAHQGG